MSSEPIRIGDGVLAELRGRSHATGEPIGRLATRYIQEGLRSERHPGVFFRDGPAGRRAVVVGGPDVWEIAAAARAAPERGESLVPALSRRLGIQQARVRVALRYYAEYAQEIDGWIDANEEEAGRLEAALERERELLG